MATLASLVPPVTLLPALEHLSQFSQKIDGRCHTETAVLQHVAVFQLSVFLRFAMLYVCFTAGNHRKKATLASLVPPVTLLPALEHHPDSHRKSMEGVIQKPQCFSTWRFFSCPFFYASLCFTSALQPEIIEKGNSRSPLLPFRQAFFHSHFFLFQQNYHNFCPLCNTSFASGDKIEDILQKGWYLI